MPKDRKVGKSQVKHGGFISPSLGKYKGTKTGAKVADIYAGIRSGQKSDSSANKAKAAAIAWSIAKKRKGR